MNKYIPERINKIKIYTPTTDKYTIRLDANENPCSLPSEIMKELHTCIDRCELNRYPDPFAVDLIRSFAEIHHVESENVVAGNGSDELINLLLNLFLGSNDTIAVTAPDFSMYKFYAELIGCKIVCYGKSGDGCIDFDGFRSFVLENDCKVVIFSNPCNPTGRAYGKKIISDFISSVDCIVIIDEAYMEFCTGECSVLDLCGKKDNLIVLKTLSKAYAGAGLRVGFSISPPDIAEALRKVKSPYNLNAVSQLFGLVLLNHHKEIAIYSRQIAEATKKLRKELIAYADKAGFVPLETDANFIMLSFKDDTTAETIYNRLKEKDIIIRCPDSRHLRITCGSAYENSIFLREFLNIINYIDPMIGIK